MKYFLKAIESNNYARFSGRTRRKEYWMFILFYIVFGYVAMYLDYRFGSTFDSETYGIIYSLYIICVFIPGLAVSVRRLHDVGKSGWMILIPIIPIVGAIWLLVLFLTDSDPGENEYGQNPKEELSS